MRSSACCLLLICYTLSAATLAQDDNWAEFEDPSATAIPWHLSISPEKDWDSLVAHTYTFLGLSAVTLGIMTMLPESVTSWEEEDQQFDVLGTRWWEHVSTPPVWDEDRHLINYVAHPYFGGVYYTVARHAGYDEWESFLYSATLSFLWEYGAESFVEVASIQDLIITPIFGAAVGEWMLQTEQVIMAQGGEVMGSERLGNVSLFFLNPLGHIHSWVTNWWDGDAKLNMTYSPWTIHSDTQTYVPTSQMPYDKQFIGIELKLSF